MKKNRSLVPDYYFEKFSDVSAEFLSSIGVKGIVLDIDNTLEPYENPTPSAPLLAWFDSLANAGIKAAFVSNNNATRVELFNKNLGFPAYFKAGKPFKKNVLRALSDMGVSADKAILMGDQVFTDVWAARNSGLRAILLPPIKDKRDILTRSKRALEKPIIKKYKKRNNI
jgi:HAD superfamily phosphatase (TIGR01668 family)